MDGNFYKAVKKQSNTWFDILGLRKKYDHTLISASTILLTDVIIQTAELSMGLTSSNNALTKQLTGMRADIRLGHEISDASFIGEGYAVLMCADLLYQDHGLFRATCRGKERNGWITFSLSDAVENPLVKLDRSIGEVYNERQSDYLLYRAMIYPIFVYAFIIISALVWVTTKAIRYVKSA